MEKEFNLAVPIHALKSTSSSVNEDGEWVFEGIASTSDVDLYDEVVYPENFLDTVDFFKEKGKIYFDHDYAKKSEDWLEKHGFTKDEILNLKSPIGKPVDAKLTDEGLYIKGVLNKSHPMAKIMWEQYLTNPDETFQDQIGLSIGAKYMGQPKREYDNKKGKYVTYLPDLLLYEVSMTPEPVNPHTRTWASVLKSMINDAEDLQNQTPNYHTIEPDSVVFDEERNRLAIKSTVEGSDGVVHVFESYIDVKEDVRKAMDETMKTKAETMEEVSPEEESPEAAVEANEETEAETGMSEESPMMEEDMAAAGGDDAEGGATDMLESMVEEAGEEEAEGEMEVGEPQADDSQELILDKLDTVLDTMMQIADALHEDTAEESAPAEQQVMNDESMTKSFVDEQTMKSVVQEVLSEQDQTVSISEESTESFGNAIKAILDGFEDRIVENVVKKLTDETVVTTQKSVTNEPTATEEVVAPGVATDGAQPEELDGDVQKSIMGEEEPEYDLDSIKSLTNKYLGVEGYGPHSSQKRASVILEAEKTLGLSSTEFRQFIRKAEKGQF